MGSLYSLTLLYNHFTYMKLICPECKNNVDLTDYTNIAKDQVIECNMCGITLMVTDNSKPEIEVEIVDEGK